MKKVIKGLSLVGGIFAIAIAVFMATPKGARALQNIDAFIQAGGLQFTNNGSVTLSCSTNGTSSIVCVDNAVALTPAITIDGNTGGVALPRYTKTQIDTLVPGVIGVMIEETNGTLANQVCISTGTAASQFKALQGAVGLGCGTNN